jgi:hypothetical protein
LVALAEQLKVVAARLPHPRLQTFLNSMDCEVDGTDMVEGHRLLAQLQAAAALIRDAHEDFGDDLANWKLVCDRDTVVDGSDAAALRAQLAELNIQNDEPDTTSRKSMEKLIIGMAVVGYRYDPRDERSKVTSEIHDDLQRLGVGLDQDTVLKYLQRGAKHVSDTNLTAVFPRPKSVKTKPKSG